LHFLPHDLPQANSSTFDHCFAILGRMSRLRLQSRIFWLLALVGHAAAAGLWAWLMPRGFPPATRWFWANQAMPLGMIALVLGALWASRRGKTGAVRAVLVGIAAAWLAAAVCSRIVFPVSFSWRFLIFMVMSAAMWLAACAPALRAARWPAWTSLALLAGLAVGALLPMTQRGEAASTHPRNVAMDERVVPSMHDTTVVRENDVLVQPRDGMVTFQLGRYFMVVHPLLTFVSRSPDRCWTVFSPREDRLGPGRELLGYRRDGDNLLFTYSDDDRSLLRVRPTAVATAQIEAISRLPRDVYSHLNTFCEIQFAGHRSLFVEFSPCPGTRIEVTHSDYPVGEPARAAYVDANDEFHIVQASNAEKGPFHELARGRLPRGEPLTLTLDDVDRTVARITLDDFSAQASTALSPTAGWGLPVNAIEFTRDASSPKSTGNFFFTLAGTSLGRGWQSVGHAAGTYRNRMLVELLP
jgi:hypothetical protein